MKVTVEELEEAAGDRAGLTAEFIAESIKDDIHEQYEAREKQLGSEIMRELERRVVLSVLDRKWREHLYEMDYLQEGIGLRAMAQKDPLVEYQREGFDMFNAMMEGIKEESVGYLFNLEVQVEQQVEEVPVEDAAEPSLDKEDAVPAQARVRRSAPRGWTPRSGRTGCTSPRPRWTARAASSRATSPRDERRAVRGGRADARGAPQGSRRAAASPQEVSAVAGGRAAGGAGIGRGPGTGSGVRPRPSLRRVAVRGRPGCPAVVRASGRARGRPVPPPRSASGGRGPVPGGRPWRGAGRPAPMRAKASIAPGRGLDAVADVADDRAGAAGAAAGPRRRARRSSS